MCCEELIRVDLAYSPELATHAWAKGRTMLARPAQVILMPAASSEGKQWEILSMKGFSPIRTNPLEVMKAHEWKKICLYRRNMYQNGIRLKQPSWSGWR